MNQDQIDYVQKEYSHLSSFYFNTAAFGPSPLSIKEKAMISVERELDPSFFAYHDWINGAERSRELFAKLMGTAPEEICLGPSASDLIGLIANGIKLKKDERVAIVQGEYPSNVLGWMRAKETRGIQLDMLECPLGDVETFKKILSPQTKVLNLSYVAFDTGRKLNLKELAQFTKEREILLVLDATQCFGGTSFTQEEIALTDIIICSSYKWLLGPYGQSFGRFSQKAQEMVDYTIHSWTKSPHSTDSNDLLNYTTKTLPGAKKYDRGQVANMIVNAMTEGALEFIDHLGLVNIEQYNSELTRYFLDHLPTKFETVVPRENLGHIIALQSKTVDFHALAERLRKQKIDVSIRQGNLRLSFHLFNKKDQVDALLKALGS